MRSYSEHLRQAELDALSLDSFSRTAFDDLVRLAADTFQVPFAAITIIDRDRQWFLSTLGSAGTETPRDWALCDHTIRNPNELLVVEDASLDARFANHPAVTTEPGVRFYAGSPLTLASGYAIGALCVYDMQPHRVEDDKLDELKFLSKQVVATLEARRPGA